MNLRAFLVLGVAAIALAGCHSRPPGATATTSPVLPDNIGAADLRESGAVLPKTVGTEKTAVSVVPRAGLKAIGSAPPVRGSGDITLNFVDTDVREVVRTILGKSLQVPYTIDPTVRGSVSIATPKPVTRDQVVPILQDLLSQVNAVLVIDKGLYQVLPTSNAATRPVMGDMADASGGGEVVQLQFTSAKDLAKTLEPFVAHGGKLLPDATHNALVVSGDPLTRRTITELIRAFDVDLLAGQSYALLPVSSGVPTKVAGELQKGLMAETDGPLAGQIRVIPMTRINAILVASTQPRYIDDARRLMQLVDRESVTTEPSWHVYYVQNGQSSDLEYVLQRAFTPNHSTSTGVSDTNRLGKMTSGFASAAAGQGGANGTSASAGGLSASSGQEDSAGGTNAQTSAVIQQANGAASNDLPPALQPLSGSGSSTEDNDNGIVIIANRQNNALLIRASDSQYAVIESMLRKIDIVPLQVQIDATIAEVTLNNQLQYGTTFFFKNGGLATKLVNPVSDALSGAFTLTKSVNITLSAIQAVTKLRVLSSPQITVLDNELATIQVGDTVPYLSQTATSTVSSTAPIVSSISYQQTGVILEVIPRVNSGGLVTLDISQEVSDPVKTTVSGIDSPTFQDRRVHSRVVARDGQTIGLGGMIRDNNTQGNQGIPFLKDIPLIGAAFANQDDSRKRTELLVLITPHVIDDQRSARMLTDDLREELRDADGVPAALDSLPVGSADPNARLYRQPAP
jgi:general secretion pathway protein D